MGDVVEGEELVEVTVGFSLIMMDVLFRSVEFFRGMSGLMIVVWNVFFEFVFVL